MQSSSLSSLPCRIPLLPKPHRPPTLLPCHLLSSHQKTSLSILPSYLISSSSSGVPSRRYNLEVGSLTEAVALEEDVEKGEEKDDFVEVGYICNAHGLHGELKVKPATDFPELRFCEPGRRWLKSRVMGKETIREVDLVSGRSHPGQSIWIISISGIDTVEKAKQIVGSAILVKKDDRPSLEEGEFYTLDLIGMRVVLKENDTTVGTVVNIVNSGASDLLQVMLASAEESPMTDSSIKGHQMSGSLVWIPFVEAIIPDVDMIRRVMRITPPKGLLELNLRADSMSKKERSKMEWRERKKQQQRVISAKKKLISLGQKHSLQGFSFGGKDEKSMLANQIVDINFKLFQYAVESIDKPCDWENLSEFLRIDSIQRNTLSTSLESLLTSGGIEKETEHSLLLKLGGNLLCEQKAGIALIVGADKFSGPGADKNLFKDKSVNHLLLLQESLLNDEKFMKVDGKRILVPLVIVCPGNEVQFYQELFVDNDWFGFDTEKVWFLEEAKLPILKKLPDEQSIHRILLSSPWEIIQSPVGSGGVIDLLSSLDILNDFTKRGIEYVQVCNLSDRMAIGHPMLLGLISSRGKDVGIKIFGESFNDKELDVIFSMKYLTKIANHVEKLKFNAVPVQTECMELVGNNWVDVHPDAPNSLHLRSSIYDVLSASDVDRYCVLHITD